MILSRAGVSSPRRETIRLLAAVSGKPEIEIRAGFIKSIKKNEEKEYRDFIKKRSRGIPLQYILKKAFFMDLELFVDERVLIPRCETEILALESIKELKKIKGKKRVLDLGTGSGSVALWLALNADCRVDAVDISSQALEVASMNAAALGVKEKIRFIERDIREPYSFICGKNYDIIVSNPPYVSLSQYPDLSREVKMEPELALKGGKRGIKYIKFILEHYRSFLSPGGKILLEISFSQKEEAEKLAGPGCSLIKDLSGIYRVVKIGK